VVHEPSPFNWASADKFPALFYGIWIMLFLAGGVFIFFIPYVSLWGIRDFLAVAARKLRHDST